MKLIENKIVNLEELENYFKAVASRLNLLNFTDLQEFYDYIYTLIDSNIERVARDEYERETGLVCKEITDAIDNFCEYQDRVSDFTTSFDEYFENRENENG